MPPSSSSPALFDVHVHLGASDAQGVYYPTLTASEYRDLMQEAGVAQACVFPPQREDGYQTANAHVLQWARDAGESLLPFARLGGTYVPVTKPLFWLVSRKVKALLGSRPPDVDSLDDLDQYSGIKLLPHLDGLPGRGAFARISELDLPVLVHGGTYVPPHWIEKHVVDAVSSPVIIAHLGAFPSEEALLHDAIDVARRRDQVYLDTSGIWNASFIRHAVDSVPQKLLFGSDAPLTHPQVAWHHVDSILTEQGAGDHLREEIGGDRARQLFGVRTTSG